MDPQQRQLLERGYEALHAAGMTKGSLSGAGVGVNVGQWASEFGSVLLRTPAGRSVYASTGFSCSVTCGRVSFALGLQGPCASYDTACSASLLANHGSMRALQRRECGAALSAGVNMILSPATMRGNAIAGFTSVRGRSHTFDARADGYARGEAIDAVTVRRADGAASSSAPRMVGSAIRQDGRSASLTAPNGQAQQGVLTASIADAAMQASEMASLEAHGTGTALGDPIEAGSLSAVFLSQPHRPREPLVVGSLKANAGHTEPAAGLLGLHALRRLLDHEASTVNAQLRVANPMLTRGALRSLRARLPLNSVPLPQSLAGVSSFGYSGTIAHVMLHVCRSSGMRMYDPHAPLRFRRVKTSWSKPVAPRAQIPTAYAVPFLGTMCESTEMEMIWEQRFSAHEVAFLQGHRVGEVKLLPGTCYIEMARALVQQQHGKREACGKHA